MTSPLHMTAKLSPQPGTGFFGRRVSLIIAAALSTLAGCAGIGNRVYDLKLEVVSSPSAQWVSGGDALVRINGNIPPIAKLRVTLNGRDVTSTFAASAVGGKPTGLVTGLATGKNLLIADLQLPGETAASATSSLELTNHPASGPMFSGPQQMPFACQTDSFVLADGKNNAGRAAGCQLLGCHTGGLRLPQHGRQAGFCGTAIACRLAC